MWHEMVGFYRNMIMVANRIGCTPTNVIYLDGRSRQQYVDKLAQLEIDEPYRFPPGMFIDM